MPAPPVPCRQAELVAGRERLPVTAVDRFMYDLVVAGMFLGGSLASGTADAWSDIDLRVVFRPERHARLGHRLMRVSAWSAVGLQAVIGPRRQAWSAPMVSQQSASPRFAASATELSATDNCLVVR